MRQMTAQMSFGMLFDFQVGPVEAFGVLGIYLGRHRSGHCYGYGQVMYVCMYVWMYVYALGT